MQHGAQHKAYMEHNMVYSMMNRLGTCVVEVALGLCKEKRMRLQSPCLQHDAVHCAVCHRDSARFMGMATWGLLYGGEP